MLSALRVSGMVRLSNMLYIILRMLATVQYVCWKQAGHWYDSNGVNAVHVPIVHTIWLASSKFVYSGTWGFQNIIRLSKSIAFLRISPGPRNFRCLIYATSLQCQDQKLTMLWSVTKSIKFTNLLEILISMLYIHACYVHVRNKLSHATRQPRGAECICAVLCNSYPPFENLHPPRNIWQEHNRAQ